MKAINFKQSGVSLVGLMIAMVISLMTLAAASMLFQQSYSVSNTLSKEAIAEGTISTVLSQLQVSALNAGFGMDDNADHFIVVTDSTTGLDSVFWRYNLQDGDGEICEGFRERLTNNGRDLQLEWVSATCAAQLSATTGWAQNGAFYILENSGSRLDFSENPASNCWPYVEGEPELHTNFTITAKINDDSEIQYIQSVCLVNT